MNVLADALARRRSKLPTETTCFRWVDGELPQVSVDLFGDVAIVSFYRTTSVTEELDLAAALAACHPLRAVYVKRRPREARRAANEARAQVAPVTPLLGEPVAPFLCHELGVAFEVRPDNGLSVGLYLDARDARAFVRANAAGRRVLNTFAYTCGFGVAARLGGATRAVNVDLSRKVLDWGALNLAHNGLAADRVDLLAGDVFDWLGRFAKKAEQFDLIVLDPPGFAGAGRRRFSGQRDYHQLVAAAAPLLAPGGLLLALCNVEAMTQRELELHVERGFGGRAPKRTHSFGASATDFCPPSALKCLVFER